MTLSLFDQFSSPNLLGVPLIALAFVIPWIMYHRPSAHLVPNRLLSLETWFYKTFISQLFSPLNQAGHKWALLFTSLVIMIASLNMLGLLPYTFTPTAQLSLNMGLAFPFWLATVITGFHLQPTKALGHFLPEGTPAALVPLLVVIETVSLFIRPVALAVRLTANITAGHLLMHLISTALLTLLPVMPAVAGATALILGVLTVLELAVAMIQAYVFVLLLSLYLQENV